MAHLIAKRLVCAGAALAMTLSIALYAASTGHLRLGAGGLELVLEPGEGSMVAVKVGERVCPPECGFMDFSWSKSKANPTLLILGANSL